MNISQDIYVTNWLFQWGWQVSRRFSLRDIFFALLGHVLENDCCGANAGSIPEFKKGKTEVAREEEI